MHAHGQHQYPAPAAAASTALSTVLLAAAAADGFQVRYVLKNLVRDWSAEGALERQQCYARLVAQLKLCFEGW
jgi:hypothetical protein